MDRDYTGRVTLPAQKGFEKEVLDVARKWGADAVRDSDGTVLSESIAKMGFDVYSTLCLIREDPDWAEAHQEYLQQMYLMSDPVIAHSEILEIDIMENFFKEQFKVDTCHDPYLWWEVIDRTAGRPVDSSFWSFIPESGTVRIKNAEKWHRYTVSFLVYQIWEPVSMYNHITNSWNEKHRMPLDPRHPEVRAHLLEMLDKWLVNHPDTDIVRFTSFFYNFDLIYNKEGKERQVDWFGYLSCVSPAALEQFEREYGYSLRPEDFIDRGYYNSLFRVPTKRYLDWMDFNQRFVSEFAAECVDRVHKANKKAIMFLGDHWAGTEPYGKYFANIGLDAVVGAAGDGVTTRMISDIPVKSTEARFYPYLFPDIFCENGDPAGEAKEVWRKSRRALMRNPTDRMGYGGYLSLAVKFPEFIDCISGICEEFRAIHRMSKGTKPYAASFRVAVLNAWGQVRSWMTHQISHSMWNQKCYSYLGVMEALSGLPFDVEFISFDDIKEKGISPDTGVIINAGDAGTSWSGGELWKDNGIVTAIREWVYNGGGFIGIGEPSACEYNGAFFQLSDVLGVQKENGFSMSHNKPRVSTAADHFITEDRTGEIDYGEGMKYVYPCCKSTKVLDVRNNNCLLAVNTYGSGRAVYIAGLPFSMENTRLLSRAVFWSAGKETEMMNWHSDNVEVECTVFNETGKIAVTNCSYNTQKSRITRADGGYIDVELAPLGCKWIDI